MFLSPDRKLFPSSSKYFVLHLSRGFGLKCFKVSGWRLGISAAEYVKDATSGGRWNLKLIVCWEGLIMKDEHVDLLELSTLRSALGSVVVEILHDNFGDKATAFFSSILESGSISHQSKKADFTPSKSLKDLKRSSKGWDEMSTLQGT